MRSDVHFLRSTINLNILRETLHERTCGLHNYPLASFGAAVATMPNRQLNTRDIDNVTWRELIHAPTPYSKKRHLDTLSNNNRTTCNEEENTTMALSLRSTATLLIKSHEVSVYAV